MNNGIAEIVDVLFNGRPASKGTPTIRVALTREQIRNLENGGQLLFRANGGHIIVSLKGGAQ